MSRRSKISLIVGGIVLLATIAIYAVIRPTVFPSTIWGLCFLIYAEIVFFGGFVLVDLWSRKSSKILTWSGIGVPLSIYAAIVFVSSLVFMGTHTEVVQGFFVLQIILLVAAAVICIIIGSFSAGAKKRDESVLKAERTVQRAIDQLTLIREQTDKKAEIDKLIGGLRFSDTSATVDADADLRGAITALQSIVTAEKTSEDEFSSAIQNIELLIRKRNMQTRISKQGSI